MRKKINIQIYFDKKCVRSGYMTGNFWPDKTDTAGFLSATPPSQSKLSKQMNKPISQDFWRTKEWGGIEDTEQALCVT